MIHLSKINGKAIVVNCELIESVEGGPDTLVTLTTGSKILVQDRPGEIVGKVIDYRKSINMRGLALHVEPHEVDEMAEEIEKATGEVPASE